MAHKELIRQYIEAWDMQSTKDHNLDQVLRALNPDNQIFSTISSEIQELNRKLLEALIGPDALDWVEWWMYEVPSTEKGRESFVWINDIEYKISSFDSLYDLLLNKQELPDPQ